MTPARSRPGTYGKLTGLWQATIVLLLTLILECLFLTRANDFIASKVKEHDAGLRTETSVSAVLLKDTLIRFLDQLDALHGFARLVTEARQTGDVPMEQAAMAELDRWQGNLGDGVRYIGAIDPSGALDWTNLKTAIHRANLSGQEYFRPIADGKADYWVGAPVAGPVSGQIGIHFTKSIRGPDGVLLAVTMIDVDPRLLSDLAASAGLTGTDTLTIQRRDGVILARSSASQYIGHVNPPDASHMRAFLSAPSGLLEGISPIDGTDRVAAWQQIEPGGLILVVALDRAAHQAGIHAAVNRMYRWVGLTAVLIALLGAGAIVALRWHRRFATAEAQTDMARQSELLFREIAESLPDMVCLMGPDGTVRYANDATRALLGIPPDDLIGRPIDTFVYPDDLGAMKTIRLPAMLSAPPTRYAVRLVRPDGQLIWTQTSLQTLARDAAAPGSSFIVGVTRDMTVQRQTEAALRLAKEELDALLTATRAVLYHARVDPDGGLHPLFVSDSALHLIGYTPAEIIGTPNWFAAHFDPAFAAEHQTHMHRVLTEGSSRTKYRLRRKNGAWMWVSMFSRRIAGDGFTIVGTASDVSREHERELQLAQSAKMATLGEVSTGMAHELNQPLTAIGMLAENSLASLLEDGPVRQLVGAKLERILDQVRRAAAIIDHMRIFGRRSDAPPAPFSVEAAIDGARTMASNRLQQARIGLTIEAAANLPRVTGHAVRLEQVLLNLIANAADAIEDHAPALPNRHRNIAIRADLADGMVQIAVADQAGGIDEALLPKLFEPFFTTKPVGRGTGLGLSISYGIVADMGGSIAARNQDDGTVVTIRLPLSDTPVTDGTESD